MNILGLVASGRKLGNSEIIAKAMLGSLEGEKRLLRLSDLSIEPCRACYACLPADKPCIINDDLAYLLDQIKWADAVVMAVPCYFLGAHTCIKTIGDRLISVLNDGGLTHTKPCVIAVTYGVPGWEGYAREMTLNFARFLRLDVRGSLLIRAANPGEAADPEILAAVRSLAARLTGENKSPDHLGVHTCAVCGSSLLQIYSDGHIRCVMCDATGSIRVAGASFGVEFTAPEHSRFSPAGLAEHGHRLETIKADYLAKRKALSEIRKNYQPQDAWWVSPNRMK